MNLTTKELEIVVKALKFDLDNTKVGDSGDEAKALLQKISEHIAFESEKVKVENIILYNVVENSILPNRRDIVARFSRAFAHETDGGAVSKIVTLYDTVGFRYHDYNNLEGKNLYISWNNGSKLYKVYINKVLETYTIDGHPVFQLQLIATGDYCDKD